MLRPLISAGIILSYKCNSRCRHCLYCCSPEWSDWMDKSLLRNIFEGTIASTKEIRGFHLAGGEAFLNFPLLVESVKLATEYKIPVDYVETNGGWFIDEASTIEKLTQLQDNGLKCLLISASPYHSEHIPVEKTLGTIRAAMKVFGSSGTAVWLPEFLQELTNITYTGKVPFESYISHVGESGTRFAASYGGQLIAGGRAAFTVSQLLKRQPKEAFFGGNCSYELLKSGSGHFDLYGNIIPGCCSGITVGDCHDLPVTYKNFSLEDYPLLKILCTQGVSGIYELASSDYGYTAKDSYSSKCELCIEIRRHLVMNNAGFKELQPLEFYNQI